jgi:hypothetical protein
MELNGFKYSTTIFEEYEYRASVEVTSPNNDGFKNSFDVFTTDPNKGKVLEVINSRKQSPLISLEIIHFTTRKMDDFFINLL